MSKMTRAKSGKIVLPAGLIAELDALAKESTHDWTDREDEVLRKSYAEVGPRRLVPFFRDHAVELGSARLRTYEAIRKHAMALGVNNPRVQGVT